VKKFSKLIFSAAFLLILSIPATFSQDKDGQDVNEDAGTVNRILFVFDASQSMYGRWQSDLKYNIARNILIRVLDSLKSMPNLEVALRLYGHQHHWPPQVCTDTRLEVPFGKNNFQVIKDKLNNVTPKGTTPIAYALEQAINDFPPCANCRNVVVLITDGIEECGGDPCLASEKLQRGGIVLKPFIIGIGINFEKAFDCVGTYMDASTEDNFSHALNVVVSRVLNPTTCQVNLLDANDRATETNTPMTFYDSFSGKIMYNFIHTINSYGVPDTLDIDPLITYDLVVHTIPPVRVDTIRLVSGTHTIIPVSVPQGNLLLKMNTQNNTLKGFKTIVRRGGSMETINIQDIDLPEKYLTGSYDLEILSLPRFYVNDISVLQSHTTTVEVPVPGIAVIQKYVKGYGSLFLENDGRLEWIYSFRDTDATQESLVLMPGKYRAVYRSRYVNRSNLTVEKSFEIKSGITTNVKLQK
jgi:Ca-activated chloride channel family protein